MRSERRAPVLERAPPTPTFGYLPGVTLAASVQAAMASLAPHAPKPTPDPYPLYISAPAFRLMVERSEADAQDRRETMGLLAGTLYRWKGETYGVVRDAVTGGLAADAVSVRFTEDRAGLTDALDELGYDYVLLGWYHSHPGYSCFLSETDIATSTRMFNAPHHRAVVIDPLERDVRSFKVVDGKAVDTPWAIFEPKEPRA